MKFMFNLARLPKSKSIYLDDIDSAAARLFEKVRTLRIESLNISDYNKRYFGHIAEDITASLQLRSYMMAWVLSESRKSLAGSVFIDYGGGSGMLSLLAKELKIGTVIYNDIYDVSCHDAGVIAEALGCPADHYVRGEIDDVIYFLKGKGLSCSALASYDVIEHIYDMEDFLRKLPFLSNGSMSIFLSSGANMLNPRQNRLLTKKQIDVEFTDRQPKWGKKPTDCLRAHLRVREEMIEDYLNELSVNTGKDIVEKLAKDTRGLIQEDIRSHVDRYLKTKQSMPVLVHPTNTCDPYNGNWCEHLMDPFYLAKILADNGFDTQILAGFYGAVKHPVKRIIGEALNIPIYLFKDFGLRLAPFYSLYGFRR